MEAIQTNLTSEFKKQVLTRWILGVVGIIAALLCCFVLIGKIPTSTKQSYNSSFTVTKLLPTITADSFISLVSSTHLK